MTLVSCSPDDIALTLRLDAPTAPFALSAADGSPPAQDATRILGPGEARMVRVTSALATASCVEPEALNLNQPLGAPHRIGMHDWSDHRSGPSAATVRVYIRATLVYEATETLENHDMWDVARIRSPEATVEAVQAPGGGAKITPGYQNPHFVQP